MRKKILCLLLVLLCASIAIIFPPKQYKSEAMSTSAKGMCLIEQETGRIIYSKNENLKLSMASTTKVVTAITVIENCDNLDEKFVVNNESIGVEGTSIYLRKGEEVSVKDLLYGLMLRSGNDSAVALACHVGGSVEKFAKMMNDTAKKVGANNSNFTNPHGLDDKNHYTTAYDLAKISAYALGNDTFKEIVSTKSHIIPATNKSDKRYLTNKNKLLTSLDGCCGVKTGFTSRAGRCLVSSAERDGMTIVCVVLNCGPMFEESASMINSAFENYKKVKLIDKNIAIEDEKIGNKEYKQLYMYPEEDFDIVLSQNELDEIKIEYNFNGNKAEINSVVGEIKIFLKKDLIKTIKLITMNKIDKMIEADLL
ncbi:MAG: D-alanyl-D-alanine carboxypeptidase [Clostridia bacterium]|nr:D-alanyl-D-alanine carboxypeptidase [Clostridia bacterium]